jgi:hypothetical protein
LIASKERQIRAKEILGMPSSSEIIKLHVRYSKKLEIGKIALIRLKRKDLSY